MNSKRLGCLTGAGLLSLAGLALTFFPPVQMPNGTVILTRARTHAYPSGAELRVYVHGTDFIARQDVDVEGDGRFDYRGDNWSDEVPELCRERDGFGWRSAPPADCAAALHAATR